MVDTGAAHPRTVADGRHARPGAGRGRTRRRARRVARVGDECGRPHLRRVRVAAPRRLALRGARPDRHRHGDQRDDPRPAGRVLRRPGTGPTTPRSWWWATSTPARSSTGSRPSSVRSAPTASCPIGPPCGRWRRHRVGASVLADPDIAEGFAAIDLPAGRRRDPTIRRRSRRARSGRSSTRWRSTSSRPGSATPRCAAKRRSTTPPSIRAAIVRWLDSPEIVVSADGADLEASTQCGARRIRAGAPLRVQPRPRCNGPSRRSGPMPTSPYAGRDSRQDADFADEYVDHVLLGDAGAVGRRRVRRWSRPSSTGRRPQTVAYGLVERLDTRGRRRSWSVCPTAEAADVPDESVFVEQAATVRDREIEPPATTRRSTDALMEAPDPVEADLGRTCSTTRPTTASSLRCCVEFDNGVRVSLNSTPIAEGEIAFEGRSPGGLGRAGRCRRPGRRRRIGGDRRQRRRHVRRR